MDFGSLDTWGFAAIGITVLGLPVQIALGFAIASGRRVPVAAAVCLPVAVMVLGLLSVSREYSALVSELWELADPAWAPWYTLYDRAAAAQGGVLGGWLSLLLVFPALLGAATCALRGSVRGTLGPLLVAAVGLAVGVCIVALGLLEALSVLTWLGLLMAVLALLAGGALAATRARHLAVPGVGAAGLATGALGAVLVGLGSAELRVTDLFVDLTVAHTRVDGFASIQDSSWRIAVTLLTLTGLSVAATLPALGFVRARDGGPRQGLDIAATAALLGGAVLSLAWVLIRHGVLARLAAAHSAWVLAAGPGYDVPRVDVLPPRVLVPGAPLWQWVELREGGGAARTPATGEAVEVGRELRFGDGLLVPRTWQAEDLYYLLAESSAGRVSLVGCSPVPADLGVRILREPLLAVGRCGSFPLQLRVVGAMPNPRELILVPGRCVQDGLDVIELHELKDVAGRDVVLRMQVDATWDDVLAALTVLQRASAVYLGWGVTTDGEDLAIGVVPGLRVVERVPTPAAASPPALVPGSPEAVMAGE